MRPVFDIIHWQLLEPRVFGFGLFQDGDVGIGVFPKREEILICTPDLRAVTLRSIGTAQLEMRELVVWARRTIF